MNEPTLRDGQALPARSPPSPGPSILKGTLTKSQRIAIAKRQAVAAGFLSSISLGVPDPIPPPDLDPPYPSITPRPLLSHSTTLHSVPHFPSHSKGRPSCASSADAKNVFSLALDGNEKPKPSTSVVSQGSFAPARGTHSSGASNSTTANRDIANAGHQDSMGDARSGVLASSGSISPRGTPRSILRAGTHNEISIPINSSSLEPTNHGANSPSAIKASGKRAFSSNNGTCYTKEDIAPRHAVRPADLLAMNHIFGASDNNRYVQVPLDASSLTKSSFNQLRLPMGTTCTAPGLSNAPSPQAGAACSRDFQGEGITGNPELRRRRSSGSLQSLPGHQDSNQLSVDVMGTMSKFTMPFSKHIAKKKQRVRVKSIGDRVMDKIGVGLNIDKKKKADSYAHTLDPSGSLLPDPPESSYYDPFFFEDPDIIPPDLDHLTNATKAYFMGSLVDKRAENVKREMNEHFREVHPEIDQSLTLSQVRNLKRLMLEVGRERDMEISSIACSYVYLEKLILKNHVSKINRKLIAACCLLLAAKVNDPKEFDYAELMEVIDKEMDVSPREVQAHEFQVYAALEFVLFLPGWEIYPHMQRILQAMEIKIEDYLHGRKFFLGNS
ncbi:hypothetical protein SeMB42_g00129 [Synchytrium endobioticum]|uniref:Cyclin N-terminal domain-containing protein n=1 Tax=Synchytrium endobioticum TaxID=286115 RepID=A0A507DUL7_9FUNG|nr:hypothetical protein SeLEV6574_g00223 [Synchytrium endobioticum]TPX54897.1 hypothetical protein SeMB42_g00129 [Synchytrium endobioticum]